MLRRIVTLLALLSGLTIFGAPAQAALTQALGNHAEACQSCEQARADDAIVLAQHPALDPAFERAPALLRAGSADVVAVPAVLFGIDRAFE